MSTSLVPICVLVCQYPPLDNRRFIEILDPFAWCCVLLLLQVLQTWLLAVVITDSALLVVVFGSASRDQQK